MLTYHVYNDSEDVVSVNGTGVAAGQVVRVDADAITITGVIDRDKHDVSHPVRVEVHNSDTEPAVATMDFSGYDEGNGVVKVKVPAATVAGDPPIVTPGVASTSPVRDRRDLRFAS